MTDDVILAKAQTIERCIMRAREELSDGPGFASDYRRLDAAVLNIQRACEAAIDIAFRITRLRVLGVPANTREAFELLVTAGIVTPEMAQALRRMTGFRNVAVHRYTELDVEIVENVILFGLDDLKAFASLALELSPLPDAPS